jgi:iron(III) transport system ATP-binding protein
MNEGFLVLRGITKRFGDVLAVDGVDLDLAQGRMLALLGPSGCGKTTLLRIIAGFEVPNGGEIALGGQLLNSAGRHMAPEKRRVAMVFQDFALFPHLNVAANVAFGLPRGVEKKRRIAELLDLVGLSGLEGRMPHQLSGGQQQRVALARALAPEPRLILLDEPFSNLDPSIRARVRAEVKQLIGAVGITAVFVTHDQEEALSLAEQVGVMMAGRLAQLGSPEEIYANPASPVVGEFVGGANFLPGTVHDGTAECALGRFPVEARFTGPASIMVRTESLVAGESGLPVVVDSVEYYGHDQLVTARLQDGSVVRMRVLAARHFSPGDRVSVSVRGSVRAFPAAS